jgi:hypothetical protein
MSRFRPVYSSVTGRLTQTGLQVPANLSHAALKSWAAEECLVWVRLIWRPLFQVLIEARRDAGDDVPELYLKMKEAWQLLEQAMLPMLDRRGMQLGTLDLQVRIIRFLDYMNTTELDGVRVFSAAYFTISFHQLIHIPQVYIFEHSNSLSIYLRYVCRR